MTATMVPTGAAVDAARVGVDGLLSAELTSLSSTELTGLASDLEVQQHRMEAMSRRDSKAGVPGAANLTARSEDCLNDFPVTFSVGPELSYPCLRFRS